MEKETPKTRHELSEWVLVALCCVLGLLSKRIISPATNLLTDFVRMPGGGTAGGIAMSFLVLGAYISRRPWMGSFMGFLQGLLSLVLGMSGYQGLYSLITFTVPGVVIDIMRFLGRNSSSRPPLLILSCCLANATGAVFSNLLVFRFTGLPFLLWLALAASSGLAGGMIASVLYTRLRFYFAKG